MARRLRLVCGASEATSTCCVREWLKPFPSRQPLLTRGCRLLFGMSVFVQSLPFGCTVHDAEGMVEGACARWMGADREGGHVQSWRRGQARRSTGRAPTHRQASQTSHSPHVPVRKPNRLPEQVDAEAAESWRLQCNFLVGRTMFTRSLSSRR